MEEINQHMTIVYCSFVVSYLMLQKELRYGEPYLYNVCHSMIKISFFLNL